MVFLTLRGAHFNLQKERQITMEIKDLNGKVLISLAADNLYDAILLICAELLYLRGANLYEADLRGADLRGANLYEADLRELVRC